MWNVESIDADAADDVIMYEKQAWGRAEDDGRMKGGERLAWDEWCLFHNQVTTNVNVGWETTREDPRNAFGEVTSPR
jgi:hypothetical protein